LPPAPKTADTTKQNGASAAKKGPDAATVIAASRQEIRTKTRNDWEWPLLRAADAASARVDDDTVYVPRTTDALSPSPSPGVHPITKKDPYRFQNPDAVGDSVEERRKRKRQEAEEEQLVNSGLRVFEARRDAWTGTKRLKQRGRPPGSSWTHKDIVATEAAAQVHTSARRTPSLQDLRISSEPPTPSRAARSTKSPLPPPAHLVPAGPSHASLAPPASDSAPATPSTHTATTLAARTPPDSPSTSPPHSPTPGPSTDPTLPQPRTAPADDGDDPSTPYTPLCPPLLPPTHPTRSLITPAAYPSIYSRVVVQGTAPRLPIPLSDLVASCVQGWKGEGEWPPRGPVGGPEPLLGRMKKKGGLRDGLRSGEGPGQALVGSVKRRVLRIVGGGRGHAEGKGDAKSDGKGADEGGDKGIDGLVELGDGGKGYL
jgi:hypothetical protein